MTLIYIFSIIFIAVWIYTIYAWWLIKNKGIKSVYLPFIYSNISNLFTTIGVLGTFIGIAYGLYEFNEDEISESIPMLLHGLRSAFITSIIGIASSIVAGRISAYFEIISEKELGGKSNDELAALNNINNNILEMSKQLILCLKDISNSVSGNSKKNLYEELAEINMSNENILKDQNKQTLILQEIKKGVTTKNSNLIQELNGLRTDQNKIHKDQNKKNEVLMSKMEELQNAIAEKISMNTVQINKNETILKSITEEIQKQSSDLTSGFSEITKNQVDATALQKENAISIIESLDQNNTSLIEQLNVNKDLIAEKIILVNEQLLLNKDSLNNLSENIVGLLNNIIKNLNDNNSEQIKSNKENFQLVLNSMQKNNEMLTAKFKEFTDLLAKSNTEALVNMMKEVTSDFNKQMSALIEKLVKENFEELNNSVKNMNDWQKENKEMIGTLTDQFSQVSNNIKETSVSVYEITKNTKELTQENGSLSRLIQELQKVMINDTKFKEITGKLGATVDTLKDNTDSFDKTSSKLNKWIQEHHDFSDSVKMLLTRLEEIDRIKDINEVFWSNTKKQLNEGVGLIEKSNKKLAEDIVSIDKMFHERLNETLMNLDSLIISIIAKNKK